MNKKQMTCQDFSETLENEYFFDELIDEQYWSGGYRSNEYFEILKAAAEKSGVTLTDVEDFDYDRYYHELYKNSEKGLS